MTLAAALGVDLGNFTLDVDLTVAPGEVLALLGPNGAGKSTVLRTLAGLVALDRGRIDLDGSVLDDAESGAFVPVERRPVGVVFQDYLLFAHMTALENVAFGMRARGTSATEARRRANEWLERVGIGEHAAKHPRQLSGGQAQRVALARALATDPRLLLLDEPLAALDVGTRRDVRRDLRHHLASFDGMRLLVTHDPVDAYALADRVAVLEDGKVVQLGTVAELTAHPRSRYVAELIGVNLLRGTASGDRVTVAGGAQVVIADTIHGEVFAVIPPSAVALSLQAPAGMSARNSWSGVVADVDRVGERVRVVVDAPVRLTAEITNAAMEALALRPGDAVHATVKATEVTVYPA